MVWISGRGAMRHIVSFGLALAAACLLAPPPLIAQAVEPGKEGELARIVAPRQDARACFGRIYGARHLQTHPDQRVAKMDFRLAYEIHEPDQFFPKGQRNYYFQLRVGLRDQKQGRPLQAFGECAPSADGKRILCGVECYGGGVVIRRRDGGKLLIDLAATGRIRMTEGCDDGEEDGVELLPGKDDRTFLLNETAAGQCPAYEDW